ncbi:MAG TPA: toll/interleukin-1 receptor domain-containing protein [Burkholderiaceae bacterium]|nr:toll/interleukin-1 receptor domain-containing protein [Burkholderiaceae bacterium]
MHLVVDGPYLSGSHTLPLPESHWKWDVFISYAQEPDRSLARELRDGLQSFGKAPFALRRTRVFLDKASLAASADLPRSLRDALLNSRKLLVLCSPEAARSKWVAQEAQIWLDAHGPKDVLLVLTAGRLTWLNGDFRHEGTDALPDPFYGAFPAEPLWVDATWRRGHVDPGPPPALHTAVAQLAAAVLELPLDELEGDDVRSRRLLARLRTAAIVALVILTSVAVILAFWAESNRRAAVVQRDIATQRALAISSQAAVIGVPSFASAQRAAAHVAAVDVSARGPETWMAAFAALQWLPNSVAQYQAGVSGGAFVPHGTDYALVSGRTVSLRARTGREYRTATVPHEVEALAWAPSGRSLLVAGRSREISLLRTDGASIRTLQWDAAAGGSETTASVRKIAYPSEQVGVVFTSEGLVFVDVSGGSVRTEATPIDRFAVCGNSAIWSGPDGAVLSQDITSPREPRLVHHHKGPVTFLACADDGTSVASAGADDEIVWTRADRSTRMQLRGVRSLALASAGDRLAVNTSMVLQSGRADIRDGRNETLLFADNLDTMLWRETHSPFSTALAFHGDDLLVADDKSALLRVDARHLRRIDRMLTGDQVDHLIGLSRPGDVLVVTKDGKVEEVDFVASTHRPLGRTTGWVTKVAVSDDRLSVLLFSRMDGADIEDQREAAILIGVDLAPGPIYFERSVATAARPNSSEIMSLRARPDGWSEIASTPLAGRIDRRPLHLEGHFESLEISVDESHLMLWGHDGLLLVQRDGQEVWRDSSWAAQPEFVGGGTAVLLRSEAPQVLTLADRKSLSLPFETGNPGTISITPDLRFAYVVAEDFHQLWDLFHRQPIYRAAPNNSWSAAFAPDGSFFVAAVEKGGLDVIELNGDRQPRHIPVPLTVEGEIVFVDSGHEVLLSGPDGVARIDLRTGVVVPVDVRARVARVKAAPKERGLVVSYADNTVDVFDATGRSISRVYFSDTLGPVEFAHGGDLVALGSHDGGVRLVDMVTGRLLADIRTETGAVLELTFVSNEEWLLIDGLRRSSLVPLDPYLRVCRRATRPLSTEEWREVGGSGPVPAGCKLPS